MASGAWGAEASATPMAEWKCAFLGIFTSFCKGGEEKKWGGEWGKVRFHPQRFRRLPGGDTHIRRSPSAALLGRLKPTLTAPAPAAAHRPSFPPLPARRHFVASAPLAVASPGGHFVKREAGRGGEGGSGAVPAVPRARRRCGARGGGAGL